MGALALVILAGGVSAVLVERDEWGARGDGERSARTAPDDVLPRATPASDPASDTASDPPLAPTAPPTGVPAVRYVFPVAGKVSYAKTHHDYPATDIIAACGSAVRAVYSGVVLEVNRADSYDAHTDDAAARGGLFVSLLADDGVRYYGSHLRTVAAGVEARVRVRAGQTLGAVGDSGNASACHLHFGISPPCAEKGDWWVRRGTVWPWSYLDSWRKDSGRGSSPADMVSSWVKAHGCPAAPR